MLAKTGTNGDQCANCIGVEDDFDYEWFVSLLMNLCLYDVVNFESQLVACVVNLEVVFQWYHGVQRLLPDDLISNDKISKLSSLGNVYQGGDNSDL